MLKYYLDKTGKVIKSILFPSSEFVDTEPREGSMNPVTSGGVADALGGIDDIKELIPESASAENKLATESEVGSLKDGGALTSAASIDVPNNAASTLSTSEAALTLNVNVGATEVPNFAVEITAGAAITLTVTKTVGDTVTSLYASAAGGDTLESGKFYQLTCVGNCWTLAEFTVPTP